MLARAVRPGAGTHRLPGRKSLGAVAQLGERLPCTQEVSGSIPLSSTTPPPVVAVGVRGAHGGKFSGIGGEDESRLERLSVRTVAAVWVLRPEGSLTRWKCDSAIVGVEASAIDVVNV